MMRIQNYDYNASVINAKKIPWPNNFDFEAPDKVCNLPGEHNIVKSGEQKKKMEIKLRIRAVQPDMGQLNGWDNSEQNTPYDTKMMMYVESHQSRQKGRAIEQIQG